MKPSVETWKEEFPNLPNTLREYQHANPEEDNQEILRNMSRALAYIWEVLQWGNIEKIQPKKKANIEKHLRGFLYESFSIYDEKWLNIAITDITQHVINENVEKFIESFLGIFGITLSGAMLLLWRARWTPIDTRKSIVGVWIPQRIKDKHAKVQEAAEHALRMDKVFAEVEALPKAIDPEEAPVESNPEDERIANFLEYTQQAMNDFRVDILEIPMPFLQDLFLFLKLRMEIGKLEDDIKHKEHLRSQINHGKERINAILYPRDGDNRKNPDRRRIRRTERLSEENSIERRDHEIRSIRKIIAKRKQELSRKKKQFNKCHIQDFPTNLQIIEEIYKSFWYTENYPKPKNIHIIYSQSEIRKIILRALLRVANLSQKDKNTKWSIPQNIGWIHKLIRIRRMLLGDIRNLQDYERQTINEKWSQSQVKIILAVTIVQMIANIDMQYTFKIPKD